MYCLCQICNHLVAQDVKKKKKKKKFVWLHIKEFMHFEYSRGLSNDFPCIYIFG